MSVKKISKLDEEVSSNDEGKDWEEKNIESTIRDTLSGHKNLQAGDPAGSGEPIEEEAKKEAFSIGDTMLARGKSVKSWGPKNLEDAITGEDLNKDFDSKDSEKEEEDGGFSYDVGANNNSDDSYGETASSDDSYGGKNSSVDDLYGGKNSSVDDSYGPTRNDDSVSMYNTSGGIGESSLYNFSASGNDSMSGSGYTIEGPKSRKGSGMRMPKSGLERGARGHDLTRGGRPL